METQIIKITDRNNVEINNVKNVISFNSNEFLLDTPYGNLKITGKNLLIGKMDTEKKELTIKGNIDNVAYQNVKGNVEKKESTLKKLFK